LQSEFGNKGSSRRYKQVRYRGGYAKQRKIICAKDRHGNGGCGHIWNSYEIPEELLGEITGI
jgi:hypothetical protein